MKAMLTLSLAQHTRAAQHSTRNDRKPIAAVAACPKNLRRETDPLES